MPDPDSIPRDMGVGGAFRPLDKRGTLRPQFGLKIRAAAPFLDPPLV